MTTRVSVLLRLLGAAAIGAALMDPLAPAPRAASTSLPMSTIMRAALFAWPHGNARVQTRLFALADYLPKIEEATGLVRAGRASLARSYLAATGLTEEDPVRHGAALAIDLSELGLPPSKQALDEFSWIACRGARARSPLEDVADRRRLREAMRKSTGK